MPSESPEILPESEETQLCLSCLAPNEISAHFCVKCRAPLSFHASTGPFERLFAEGFVYRHAAQRPRNLIVVMGVWLIFFPMMLMGLSGMADMSYLGLTQDRSVTGRVFGALVSFAVAAVSGAMIWKTTQNFLAGRQMKRLHSQARPDA
jgi:heme/copper-type cytochrome/quinol oxidase subunit 1